MVNSASHNVSAFPVFLHSHVSFGLTDVLQAAVFFALNTDILMFRNHASLISASVNSICKNASEKCLLLISWWNSKTTHG